MTAARPPRVLVCARPGTGGAARVIEAMLRRLPERGITGTAALSSLEGDDLLDAAAAHGWAVVRWDVHRHPRPLSDAAAALRLRRLLPGHDLVHAHAAKAGALARIAVGRRAPVIYSPHGFFFAYHPVGSAQWNRYRAVERRLASRTSLLHCVSASELRLALAHGLATEGNALLLPNPVPPRRAGPDPEETLRREGVADDERVVLMVARLAPPKDPVTFVRAAAMVDPSLRTRFVLVGKGPLLDVARAAAETDAVVFPGGDVDVRGLLGRSRVAVLASGSEALPLYLLEALAESVPIVATDLDGCRDAAADAALYVPPADPQALAAAVERLLRDDTLHARLATAARVRAPLFDENRWVDGLVAAYGRVTGGGASDGRA